MRYADLKALPMTPDEAKTSIIDLVMVAVGNGKTEIPMDEVLDTLHQQGWDLTRRMVMDVLTGNDMVKRTTKDEIILKNEDAEDPGEASEDEKDKSFDHVSKMAKKALKKESR